MSDPLSQKFAALADPTRRALLARLSRGETSVSELAEPFLHRMSLPAVTKHLQVLERAKLITKTREAQRRPCQLNGEEFRAVAEWVEQYRVFWEESFDRLGDYLKTVSHAVTARTSQEELPKSANVNTAPLATIKPVKPKRGNRDGRN